MSTGAPRHCTGCGRAVEDCPTAGACQGRYEPPRYCGACGRRLRVLITPAGWTATCREHGGQEGMTGPSR